MTFYNFLRGSNTYKEKVLISHISQSKSVAKNQKKNLSLSKKKNMKSIFKKLLIVFGILVLLILGYTWMNYAADKSLEELKAKWAYDNSQFLEMDGMPVHYRINGEGEPLVLIHGTGASLHTWEGWTEILEKDFKVISLDMPAFGLTGPNPKRVYTLEYYAKFLDAFLAKIEVDKFSIAGNSLGGGIAWKYASLFPNKVKSMILIDPMGYPWEGELPFALRLAANKYASQYLKTVTPKSLFYKSMNEVFHNDELVTEELVNRYYDLYLREGNRQAFVDRAMSKETVDTLEIATIKTPTLILWGEKDEWISPEDAPKFQRDIKGSELIIYPNAGHVPMEELPKLTARDARIFLEKNLVKEMEAELSSVEE
jgi:pimeloyl-ACP methyl ester carboxylesterase